jgi:hypothetical protein
MWMAGPYPSFRTKQKVMRADGVYAGDFVCVLVHFPY